MALEGRLRDLALTEVLQLLALGRKTGVLHCHAPLQGRKAQIAFDGGVIIDADVAAVDRVNELALPRRRASDRGEMQAAVQDVLLWRDGVFRFAPGERPLHPTTVRVAVEPLLMEAAASAEVWQRIEARVPHARVIPAFVDVEPRQLPLLRLSPPQWDILTRVDGQRDLMALASLMQRDVTDIALLVHDLIGAGLLTLREGQAAQRKNPTPPAIAAIPTVAVPAPSAPGLPTAANAAAGEAAVDLWVPSGAFPAVGPGSSEHDDDSLFDPVAHGVLTADGVPLLETDWATAPVAPAPVEPSLAREQPEVGATVPATDEVGPALCHQGDALARAGDLVGAMAHWNAALRATLPLPTAERLREAVALAARLHALLPP
ncbi:DUF4388 domain-containing protein [Gemmatimonas sp.]